MLMPSKKALAKELTHPRRQPLRLQLKPAMRRRSLPEAVAARTPRRRQQRVSRPCRQPTAWPNLGPSNRARGRHRRAARYLLREVRHVIML